ncbi:Inherit from COG: Helicase [Seminavis robusta]|uniref:Inherit from COG: Helicase n=1 Tax=Seminavis robusta TaxID=568900 RepID=A0A9N8H4Y5_9STRA|nr:Inherit from COG: Helicase [Seminavis robusta]|eukprot:Sro98_g050350.1 Inherit from COG: Helicase (1464) ;mRNA; r:29308-33780
MSDNQVPSDVAFDNSHAAVSQEDSIISNVSSPVETCSRTAATKLSNAPASVSPVASAEFMTDTNDSKPNEIEDKTDSQRYQAAVEALEEKYPQARRKWIDTLRYIMQAEETRSSRDIFTKTSDDNESCNPFMFETKDDDNDDAMGVLLTSSQLEQSMKTVQEISMKLGKSEATTLFSFYEVANGVKEGSAPPFLFSFAWKRSQVPKRIPDHTQVRQDLNYLMKMKYKEVKNIEDLLGHLTVDDIPSPTKRPATSRFMMDVLMHQAETLCMKTHRALQSCKDNGKELCLGIVRASLAYPKDETTQIVDGPLFEVVVDVVLDNKSKAILIRPRCGEHVKVNREVVAALTSDGRHDDEALDNLYRLAKDTVAQSIIPGTPSSYSQLVEAALGLRFNSFSKDECKGGHFPAEALILSHEFCLYSRNQMRTLFSRDARNLENALQQRKIQMTLPILGLMEGADSLEGASLARKNRISVHPLPTSARQEEVNRKLRKENRPAVVVPGPPGCGKTHSIVSECATALAQGSKVLFCSTNEAALKAFVDKVPLKIRALCMNVAGLKEGDLDGLREAVEDLNELLKDADENKDEYTNKVKELKQKLAVKKDEMSNNNLNIEGAHSEKMSLLDSAQIKQVLDLVSTFPQCFACLATIELQGTQDIEWGRIHEGWDELCERSAEAVSFGGIAIVTDEMLQLVREKTSYSPQHDDCPGEFQWPDSSSASDEDLVDAITIAGNKPTTEDEWRRVQSSLEFRKASVDPLLNLGLDAKNVFVHDGYNPDFAGVLEKGKDLREAVSQLSGGEKAALVTCIAGPTDSQAVQDVRNNIASEIQKPEEELVMYMVIDALNRVLDGDARSKLLDLQTDLEKIKATAISSSPKESEPTDIKKKKKQESTKKHQLHKQFVTAFQEAAGSMPFLVMTVDQVSKYLSAEHTFGFGVFDEASQSEYTALLAAARCKQLLIVGDNQQTSPSECGLSAARINELMHHLPALKRATKKRLLPAQSFFDLFTNTFSRSHYVVRLYEHFRCRPSIIQVCNTVFYRGRLDPLRESSNMKEVELVRVDGSRDAASKTNAQESDFIAKEVRKEVEGSLSLPDSDVHTIGIISMGGDKQRDDIKRKVENQLDELAREKNVPSKLIKRHRILFAVPQQCQGDERDVVFISLVYGGVETKKGKGRKKPNKVPQDPVVALSKMKVNELKCFCEENGLKKSGNKGELTEKIQERFKDKQVLADRLVAHFKCEQETDEANAGDDPVESLRSDAKDDAKEGGQRQKISPEVAEADKKKWCVAVSRAKERMVLVHSFDKSELTNKNDIRIKILEACSDVCSTPSDVLVDLPSPSCVRSWAERFLATSLTEAGFVVTRRGGIALKEALCVRRRDGSTSSSTVLLWIENGGESKKQWQELMDQQLSLERAGRSCLRVDCLSLVCNGSSTMKSLSDYLDAKLPVCSGDKRCAAVASSAPPTAKKPRQE